MREVLEVLQSGIILTTPVFFLATLIVLWRVLRTTQATMAVAVYLKRQLEIMGRGGLASGARPTDQVKRAVALSRPAGGESDADHCG